MNLGEDKLYQADNMSPSDAFLESLESCAWCG